MTSSVDTAATTAPPRVTGAQRKRLTKMLRHAKQVSRAQKKQNSTTLLVNKSVAKALFKSVRTKYGFDNMRIARNGRAAVRHLVTTVMSRLMRAVNLSSVQFGTQRVQALHVDVAAQLIALPGNENRVRPVPVADIIGECRLRTARPKKQPAPISV